MNEDHRPDIVVLYCGHALANGEYLPEGVVSLPVCNARFINVPCSSKIETRYLIKLIEEGNDGVLVIACPGINCQFTIGSARAVHRVFHARNLLDEVGIRSDRLDILREKMNLSASDIRQYADNHADKVRLLSRNPLKIGR